MLSQNVLAAYPLLSNCASLGHRGAISAAIRDLRNPTRGARTNEMLATLVASAGFVPHAPSTLRCALPRGVAPTCVQSWYDSGARLSGASPETAVAAAPETAVAVDTSNKFAQGLQTIQRREWVNLMDKSRLNIQHRQRVADEAPAAIMRLKTQLLKEGGSSVIEARGARVGACNQILKLVRLKEEGGRVVQQREDMCAAYASQAPAPAAAGSVAASSAAPDGFEWGPTF